MKHETDIKYDGGYKQLAEDLGNLRYDALREFLKCLGDKLHSDYIKDMARERHKLSDELLRAAIHSHLAAEAISNAWNISEPHMKTNGTC